MAEQSAEDEAEPRPRATGWFVDPDEIAVPLLVAVGRFVFMASGLETALQLELVRLLWTRLAASTEDPNTAFAKETAGLQRLPAGELLKRLREENLATALHDRIDDVIRRRNRVVHRAFEDPQLMNAATGGGSLDSVVEHVNRLAIDCGELTIELVAYAISKIEELFGTPRGALYKMVLSADPKSITDPTDRSLLEAIQAFHDPDSIFAILNELIPGVPDSEAGSQTEGDPPGDLPRGDPS